MLFSDTFGTDVFANPSSLTDGALLQLPSWKIECPADTQFSKLPPAEAVWSEVAPSLNEWAKVAKNEVVWNDINPSIHSWEETRRSLVGRTKEDC